MKKIKSVSQNLKPASAVASVALITISLAMAACSFSQNPVSSYPMTERFAVPTDSDVLNPNNQPTPVEPPPVVKPPPAPPEAPRFDSRLNDQLPLSKLFLISGFDQESAIVGKDNVLTFTIESLKEDIEFNVKPGVAFADFSTWKESATSTKSKKSYKVTIKPDPSLIADNSNEAPKDVNLTITATAATPESQALLAQAGVGAEGKSLLITFTLRKKLAPKLMVSDEFPSLLELNDTKTFKISVSGLTDPNDKPTLDYSYDLKAFLNLDFAELDGSDYIAASNPVFSNGKWLYTLTISTKGTNNPIPVAVDLNRDLTPNYQSAYTHVRTSFQVTTDSGITSDAVSKSFQIKKSSPGVNQ